MKEAELLDNLAKAIDAPRSPAGRQKRIEEAFTAYTESLKKMPWWKRLFKRGYKNDTR